MKRTLKVLPPALSFALVVLGSVVISPALANPQAADPIPSIRQQYAAINKRAPRLRKVKKELSGFSTEGGELVAYFDGKAIVKMVATYYGETGRTVEEFYYRDEKLIFAFRKVLNYDRPLSGKVVSTSEERFYFNNDQLVSWIDQDKKQVETSNPDYAAKQAEYLEYSSKFQSAARSRARTLEDWH
jgi:hypothetical protein